MSNTKKFNSLGHEIKKYDFKYKVSILERFENEHRDNNYMVMLDAYEFTTLCPITSQPDFAKIYINYVPDNYLVESKSLKLYLFSYRQEGAFHEDVVNMILNDLVELLDPKYLEVLGIFAPRGGVAIYPFASYAKAGLGYEEMKKTRQFEVANSVMLRQRNYRN